MIQHKSVIPIPQSNLHRVVRLKLTVFEVQTIVEGLRTVKDNKTLHILADELLRQLESEKVRKQFDQS